ncbi:MAG: squalene--hopene cyclase [Betaproteobacteria bacterium]|nr:squalene--hopene cyclase [Betaproteobacteria bacterium]
MSKPMATCRNPEHAALDTRVRLDWGVESAARHVLQRQHAAGYWAFELEADCTIPAEYILMTHYMDEVDPRLQAALARYLRARQLPGGGWPLYAEGAADLSGSVKAYYALKLAGDDPDAPHLAKARRAILAAGGAARANVFTRITLALFGQMPWRAVPFIPPEIILLPRWFPFHLHKVSYWSRTVMVPLLILCSLKPRARNPSGIGIAELFAAPPEQVSDYFPVRSMLNRLFLLLERSARRLERWIPRAVRAAALRRAEDWIRERANGQGGLGAIFPAMVNAYEAMDALGYPPGHRLRMAAKAALERLIVKRTDEAYCQPCVSPVWDTALAALALLETGEAAARTSACRALDWLRERQLRDEPGDWRKGRPGTPGGGWPFQFENSHYPDVDDTSAVGWAMIASGEPRFAEAVNRAAQWIIAMQSRSGGFGAFDRDNTRRYLNEIPFADHGALLDPPTADVSARCAVLLALLGGRGSRGARALARCIAYLLKEQEADGAWFGRWGTNYVYGTWSALVALTHAGLETGHPAIRRAADWLKSVQNGDGGWGETNDSYADPSLRGRGSSTSFQTAWALLGLMAAGDCASREVAAGIDYLLRTQRPSGAWEDRAFTAPGFPRVFYLKYHGYSRYFPLWALARYRTLTTQGTG